MAAGRRAATGATPGGNIVERPELQSVDDEGLPLPPPTAGKAARLLLRVLVNSEKIMFMAIALALVAIAIAVFARGIHDLVLAPAREQFAVTITRAVNNVLFIVVVLELVRTIVARLEGGGFQLQPFLVIGIISATRDILSVGAELSLVGGRAPLARSMTQLAVNAGVVVALSVALVLVLVRRYAQLVRALGAGDPGGIPRQGDTKRCTPRRSSRHSRRLPRLAPTSQPPHSQVAPAPDQVGSHDRPVRTGDAGATAHLATMEPVAANARHDRGRR